MAKSFVFLEIVDPEIVALVHDRLGLGDEDRRRLTTQLWRGTLANLGFPEYLDKKRRISAELLPQGHHA